jgi:transcription-repair coupling factor (superfamily II helicase)
LFQENQSLFIKEAIRRETLRGGQTFYVCNRIHKLEEEKYKLTQIFPEKYIDIVHGQMDPLKIKEILDNFKEGKIDVPCLYNSYRKRNRYSQCKYAYSERC